VVILYLAHVEEARPLIASLVAAIGLSPRSKAVEAAKLLLNKMETHDFCEQCADSNFRAKRNSPWEELLPLEIAPHERSGLIALHDALPNFLATNGENYADETAAACKLFADGPDNMIGPDSPKQWANSFDMSPRTFSRMRKRGEIRAKQITTKRIFVHRDDVQRLKKKQP
jgi:hypothetical protein